MSAADVTDPIAQKAIEWMVQFHSGEMTDAQRLAFEQWRAESSHHEHVCQQIEKTLSKTPRLAATPVLRKTLNARGSRREFLQGALAVTAAVSTAGWLFNRHTPLTGLVADLHTGTGERSTQRLADGTRITLNARSSVDLSMSVDKREIRLLKGQIYIETAPARAPLIVHTPNGQLSLDAGAFSIAARPQGSRIVAFSDRGLLRSSDNSTTSIVAGQALLMKHAGFSPLQASGDSERSWLDGNYEINDQPLLVLIDALRDYRTGFLRVSPEAASLRVSGIFPLDNSDYALDSLAQTLPLIVTRTTGYWVTISKA